MQNFGMRERFENEVLKPLGAQPFLNDPAFVETMYVSFKQDNQSGNNETLPRETAPEKKYPVSVRNRFGSYEDMIVPHFDAELLDRYLMPTDEFGRRSNLYEEMDKDPEVKAITDFYDAASEVTNNIAYGAGKSGNFTLPFLMGPGDHINYGKEYNQHLENISRGLETKNTNYYNIMKNGGTIPGITDAINRNEANAEMVRQEQAYVEQYLNIMPEKERETFIRLNNEVIHSRKLPEFFNFLPNILPGWKINQFQIEFEKEKGRSFDFGNQSDREALGVYLANQE